ncbi:ATP-grasp domain-containing protein [Candidatus Woesearchaeota archaeon]|nr:ATP-grasp domain-containing protein [Candidatus Woesearchaeota archaeon]
MKTDTAPSGVVIIVMTSIDDDDFSAIADNLEFKDSLLLVCDSSSAEGYDLSGIAHIIDSFKDADNLIKEIKAWQQKSGRKFAGIIGLDEEFHYSFSESIAKAFSLDFHSRKTLDLCSNKYLQRELLSKAGICVPRFMLVEPGNDKAGVDIGDIGFPNVLKVITGYASSYIFLNKDPPELWKNIYSLAKTAEENPDDEIFLPHAVGEGSKKVILDPKKQFLVEEVAVGDEYSCDFIVDAEGVHVIRVVRKFSCEGNFAFFDALLLFNPDLHGGDFSTSSLSALCRKTAKALGIGSGICMVDFKFREGDFVIIETTVRPGISTFIDLIAHIYNTTSVNKLVMQKMGIPVPHTIPEDAGLAVYLTAPRQGKVKRFDTSRLEKAADHLGVFKVVKYYQEGSIVSSASQRPGGSVLVGYVLARAAPGTSREFASPSSVWQTINKIRSLVSVEVV